MLNYDSGAAVTALPIAVAGDLPLAKRGEFRVASGAAIPNLGKIKMKSTDESGIERTLRGNNTEVAKPLLSAAEVSTRWDSLLFEDGGILLERNTHVALEIRAVLAKHKSLESSWQEHETLPPRQLVQCVGKLAMSRRSRHRSSPLQAGPGWKLTMDNVTSRMNLRINLRSSGECWPLVSPQSWRGRNTLKRIMLCSHLGAGCV